MSKESRKTPRDMMSRERMGGGKCCAVKQGKDLVVFIVVVLC